MVLNELIRNEPFQETDPRGEILGSNSLCEKVIKDIKNMNNFRKTSTHGLNFGWKSCIRNHDMTL